MKNFKNIITLLFVGCMVLSVVSCKKEKDSENLAKITTYPTIILERGNAVGCPIGTEFVDPGYTALEGSLDITDQVTVSGSVNKDVFGKYAIEYKVQNAQGYESTITRTVVVYDPAQTVNYAGSFKLESTTRDKTITITKMDGWFRMSDCWFQSAAIPVEFLDLGGGTFYVLQGNSNYGPFDNTSCTLTYDAGTETFTFTGGFTSGVNVGASWTTIWKKTN